VRVGFPPARSERGVGRASPRACARHQAGHAALRRDRGVQPAHVPGGNRGTACGPPPRSGRARLLPVADAGRGGERLWRGRSDHRPVAHALAPLPVRGAAAASLRQGRRPRGSSAFGAAVDNSLHLLRDERDPTRQRRLLLNPECRFAPEADPLAFTIEGQGADLALEVAELPRKTKAPRSGPSQLEVRLTRLLSEHGELRRADLCKLAGVPTDDGYTSRVLTEAVNARRFLRTGRGRYALPAGSSLPPSAIGGEEEGGMNPTADREVAA
jgi:hypothetical protein